jgi:cytoskeletal protein CcmA (bactofilin family)
MARKENTALDLRAGRDRPEPWAGVASGRGTVIQPGLTVIGDLVSDGHIEVNGTVKGTINGYSVTVGPNGQVEGSILAEVVAIHGTLIGPVQANTVAVGKTARVVGSIFHNALDIEPGAYLDGRRPWRPHIERKPEPA